jgi:ABC-type bacteriocin/lantibiotic exporter with double-glycine peptidase domain
MVTLAIITLLVLTDPKLALIVGFSLSIIYGLFFYSIRRYISRIGKKRLVNNQLRFVTVSEAFGAAKEIKIGGLEENYIERFSIPAKIFARTTTSNRVLGQLPHFFFEAVAFGGVMLMILYLMSQKGSFNEALPIISLYIFAGYRLLPSIKEIYGSFVSITFVGPSFDKLHEDMKNLKSFNSIQDKGTLSVNKDIVLKNVNYNYPNASRTTLKDFNLIIPAKSTVGLIGTTGSGKTTTVDIILGLLEPEKGVLEIDGKIITQQNVKSWQRSIGYVPQNIYLSDDTVSANIALGAKPEEICQKTIEKVSKIANLHEFVVKELPKKYQTTIGERGVRLSGGQRQRIGIARALYHNPKVLILDEATSALDNNTEQAVMDAVDNLSKEVTIILIAHRLNTVKRCDKIYLLEKGKIKTQGKFEDLIKVDENLSLNVKN